MSRYLLVVTDQEFIDGLKAGRLDMLAALRQPRCWIVDFGRGWEIKGLWLIAFDKVPKDHLPKPGAMLAPELDPLFRLRLVGPGVGPGKTSAADVRMAAQAAESGLRGLARIALTRKSERDRFLATSGTIPTCRISIRERQVLKSPSAARTIDCLPWMMKSFRKWDACWSRVWARCERTKTSPRQ